MPYGIPGLSGPTNFGGVYEPSFGPGSSSQQNRYKNYGATRTQDVWKDPEVVALEKRYAAAHAEAIRTGNWAENDRLKLELQNLGKFKRELRWFDEEQGQFTEALRRGFRTSTELTAARQQRGVERNVGQFFAQQGLSQSGLSGMGMSVVQGNIAGEVQQAQNQFENALNMSLSQERSGFIRGQFDFFHRLSQMQYQEQLDEQMAAFQAELQRDAQRAGMFDRMLNLGGQVLANFIPGGVGPAIAGLFGGGNSGVTTLNTMNPYGV